MCSVHIVSEKYLLSTAIEHLLKFNVCKHLVCEYVLDFLGKLLLCLKICSKIIIITIIQSSMQYSISNYEPYRETNDMIAATPGMDV